MQYQRKILSSLLIASGIISVPQVAVANDSSELEQLRALVQELDQKVKILARQGELKEEAEAAAKKEAPVVKAGSSGFSFSSADGKNEIKFRGLLQADQRVFIDGANDVRYRSRNRAGYLDAQGFNDAEDTSLLRRVRPTIEGKLLGKYGFRFTPEFAGGSASALMSAVRTTSSPPRPGTPSAGCRASSG